MGDITRFYNRPCYDDIISSFSSLKYVLVKGTPGIGKTLFLQRVLVQLFRNAKLGGQFPRIHYMRYANGKIEVLSFLPDGSVSDITDIASEKHSDTEYLLSDSIDISDPYGTVLNLEVASDEGPNYNHFTKRIKEKFEGQGLIKIMPLFSFEELLCIKPVGMEEELAQLRYDVYGGSARNFMNISDIEGSAITIVEDEMKRFFGQSVATLYPKDWQNIINDVSSLLRTKNDLGNLNNLFNSMMQHTLPGDMKEWASPFMHHLAAAITDMRDISIYNELKEQIGKSGLGVCFESLGHRKLWNSEKQHLLKPLLHPIPDLKPKFLRNTNFTLPVTILRKISDIKSLKNKRYGFPVFSNFPLVDAIIQPNTLIQFTTSPNTHKGASERIEEIRGELKGRRQLHRMVFIVPHTSKNTFRYQKGLGDILQFMCFDDPVVSEDILMSTVEETKWMKSPSKGDEPKFKKLKVAA
jgi:hypothetical protein